MESSNSVVTYDNINFYKVWKAIFILTNILRTFVKTRLEKLHARMIRDHGKCTKCLTANILQCPSPICKKRGRKGMCKSLHNGQNKQYRACPGNTCEHFRDTIIKNHRYQTYPSWGDTSAERWAISYWQIAKCFLPTEGYKHINSIQDTDFNGIISILLNCTAFDNRFSFALTTSSCLFTKARNMVNPLRHSPQGDVTDQDLTELFRTFFDILKEGILAQLADANTAENTLRKLENDILTITTGEKKEIDKQAISKREPFQLPTHSDLEHIQLTDTTLLPTALVNLTNLTNLILSGCQCDDLDVSQCHDLERIEISGPSTLSGNSMHGLKKLKYLKLYDCKCDRLDVALCCILEEMDLRGASLSLLGSSVQNLHNLKRITLMCSCEVDLTCCYSLEIMVIKSPATLLSATLCTRDKKKLKQLTLDTCKELKLEYCPNLELLYLGEEVTVCSTSISELKMLKNLTAKCKAFCLDLTFFPNLEKIWIKDPVRVNVKSLMESKMLKHLTLESYCFDKTDMLSVLQSDGNSRNRIPLPPSIEHIKCLDVGCTVDWLRHLFTSLSNLNHNVQCTLYERYIMSSDEERVFEENFMSNVSLKCKKDSKGLYEALEGSKLQQLSLKTVEHKDWFAKIKPSRVKIA